MLNFRCNHIRQVFFLVVIAIFTFSAVNQECRAAEITVNGIYSNMKSDSAEGDVSGFEIFIFGTRKGYQATIQCASGEPYEAFLSFLVISENKFNISVPAKLQGICGAKIISGHLLKDGLSLYFSDSKAQVKLLRGHSFWIE